MSTIANSESRGKRSNLNFISYQEAMTYLGDRSRNVPAIVNSTKLSIDRFSENTTKIYCEPLASNLRDALIAGSGTGKKYLEEGRSGIPIIVGEYTRLTGYNRYTKARIKIGLYDEDSDQSMHFYISPWTNFPTKSLSFNEKRCLLRKVIGSPHLAMLPPGTALRESPRVNAKIISSIGKQPVKVAGFTDEADHRWWIVVIYDPIRRQEEYLYAQNIAQFVIGSSFGAKSLECDILNEDGRERKRLKSNRNVAIRSIRKKLMDQGFYNSNKLNKFGIKILNMCQEVEENNIDIRIKYKFNKTKIREKLYSIEYKYNYNNKTKYYDISGEIDSLSSDYIKFIKKELVNLR